MTPGTATRLGRRNEGETAATAEATTSKTTHDRGGERSDGQGNAADDDGKVSETRPEL